MALDFKICAKCKKEKELEDFHRQSDCAFGRRTLCKTCRSGEASARRLADPLARTKDKARYEKRRAAAAISSRKWKKKAGLAYRNQQREYRLAHKKEIAAVNREWHAKNRARNLARKSKWRTNNIDRVNAYNALYDKRNSDRAAAKQARRRAQILRATPKWNNEFYMREAYRLAALRTKMLGFAWNVDHIVPLRSKTVCGLHVHNNLRVIPFSENMKKGNRVWPNMPEASWH